MPAEIDKVLVTALKTARGGKPMQFAFVPKGQEGKLLVAKKVAPKQVDALKKEVGATLAFRGRCVSEDGVLVFEVVKDPPATLQAQLRKCLKEDAGLTIPIVVRVKADAEDEGPEGEGEDAGAPARVAEDASPPPPGDPAAEWKTKLLEWSPTIKQAIAEKHPRAADIQKLLQDAAGLAKPGGDFAAAILRLKAAVTLAAAPPAPTAAADEAADWKSKLAEWSPAIKQAVADKHPRAADIQKLLQDAAGLAKPGGDYAAAVLRLKAAHTLASGSQVPKPPSPPSDGGAVTARFNALAGALKTALAAKGPNFAELAALATAVQKSLKTDAAAAATGLDKLEALLAGTGTAIGPNPAVLAALDALQDAGETVDKQIEKLQAALRRSGDEELEAIAEYGLNGVTGDHRARLIALGLELRKATGPAADALAAKARPLVASYRNHLNESAEVAACDDNPFDVAVSIRGTLVPALDRLAAAIA